MTQSYPSDVAFTPAVKEIQARKGSRTTYAKMEASTGWRTEITADLRAFLAERNSAYLATAAADGQPYIQHRGGPTGFLVPLDAHRIGFADFKGNRQFISQGNLTENPKAYLFLMDYVNQRRVKIWGTAKVIEDDPFLVERLMPENYRARPEQAIVFTVAAWDTNCPQHIPRMFGAEDVSKALAERDEKIARLEAELAALRG